MLGLKSKSCKNDYWLSVVCAAICCAMGCLPVGLLASGYRFSSGYVPDQLLCLPKPQIAPDILADFLQTHSTEVMHRFSFTDGLLLVGLEPGKDVLAKVAAFEASGLFEFAEPDYVVELARSANERSFDSGWNWGLNNQGESKERSLAERATTTTKHT